jgi:hypothetical protein
MVSGGEVDRHVRSVLRRGRDYIGGPKRLKAGFETRSSLISKSERVRRSWRAFPSRVKETAQRSIDGSPTDSGVLFIEESKGLSKTN